MSCASAIATPVIRHRSAAVRNDHPQRRKIPKIRGQKLHEGGGVGVDVVRAGRVEVRVARRADVHHRRHVQFDQLLVERIPVAIDERRRGPHSARWIGIQVAPMNPKSLTHRSSSAMQLASGSLGVCGNWHADEVLREQRTNAMDQIVALPRPVEAGAGIADVMRHRRRARREIVTSVPRSLWNLSCGCTLSRSWSSETWTGPGVGIDASFNPAICASRNVWSSFGAVV